MFRVRPAVGAVLGRSSTGTLARPRLSKPPIGSFDASDASASALASDSAKSSASTNGAGSAGTSAGSGRSRTGASTEMAVPSATLSVHDRPSHQRRSWRPDGSRYHAAGSAVLVVVSVVVNVLLPTGRSSPV
jgi:hypothetical protein